MLKFNDDNLVPVVDFVSKGANLEAKDKKGFTPLLLAAYNGDLKMVEFLVSKGANLEAKDIYDSTPLLWAVRREGNLPMVEFLVSKGANIDLNNILRIVRDEKIQNFFVNIVTQKLEQFIVARPANIVACYLY